MLAPTSKQSEQSDTHVGWGFIAVYALAYTGTWLALLTPVLVTIAMRVRQLTPASAAQNLALVLGIGAVFALLSNPLFGRLSDRTTSRFGMRRPWLIGGAVCGSLALLLIATANTIEMVLIGWCCAQLAFNAVLAALVAVLPDQVPATQRGTVAGVLGICMPIGQLTGTFLVDAVGSSPVLAFMVPAVIGSAAIVLLAWILDDRRQSRSQRAPLSWRELAGSFWVNPKQHPDFAWAWLSRFLLVLGTAFLTTYQTFYLIDKLGHSIEQIPTLIFKATLVQASMVVAMSLLCGRLSDALNRRKLFAITGSCAYAVGLWIIALADSYSTFLIGMAVTGIGQGIYFAVDLALVTEVLPDRRLDAAKDLGILNVSNALPQSIAPALAPLILVLGNGDYLWVFMVAGAIALTASFAVLPVRGVR